MRIRDTVLDDRHSFAQSALTWTFNIDLVDPVTEFKVHFRVHNDPDVGVETAWEWPRPVPYVIKEIAIIDGSEVIFALNGAQCIAMSCFDLGYAPFHWHQENPGAHQFWNFPIHFGRSLVDPEWIFDPKKFRNPQMRITWDLEEGACTIGPGGYTDEADELADRVQISVYAKVMEEGARPRGYLMTKEVKSYIPAGPGNLVTYLPVDFPHRKLMVRSYAFNNELMYSIEHIKISQDQDKWIPVDHRCEDFIWLMKNWFTEVQFHGKHVMADNEHREHFGGNYAHGLLTAATQNRIVAVANWASNVFRIDLVDNTDTEIEKTDRAQIWSMGMTRTPFDCLCYPFGDQEDPADWLDVGVMGNLRLILTHGLDPVAGEYADTEIVCQQAHPY